MNIGDRGKIELLEAALRSAFREGEGIAPDDAWQSRVMRTIRCAALQPSSAAYAALFNRMAWRFAAAMTLAACVLIIYCFASRSFPEQELAEVLLNEPAHFLLSQSPSV